MCDPVTMMVGSMVVGAAGSVYQMSAMSAQADAQAQIAHQNAMIADRRARDAIERGQLEEERKLREGTMLQKQQEASFTAANIDTGYGSPLDFILSSAMEADMDAAIIRMNAEREAEDYEMQAHNFRSEAAMAKAEGKNAMIGGMFSLGGSILDGGAGIMKYKAGVT